MSIDDIKLWVCDMGYENSMPFENPSYTDAVVGISTNGNVCYDYNKMIGCLVEEGITEDEAAKFISYNTIRSLDYMSNDGEFIYPIVIYPINDYLSKDKS